MDGSDSDYRDIEECSLTSSSDSGSLFDMSGDKLPNEFISVDNNFDTRLEGIYQRNTTSKEVNQSNDKCQDQTEGLECEALEENTASCEVRQSSSLSPAVLTGEERQDLSVAMAHFTAAELSRCSQLPQRNIVINNPQVYMTKTTQLSAPRARNVNMGGTQINKTSREMHRRKPKKPPKDPRLKRLKVRTESELEKWISGMITTSYVDEITKKIDKGDKWITITGHAGDGKTTTGYLVLEEMVKRGREVFHVKDTDQYHIVAENTNNSVIMLNDVLGAFSFDPSALSKWEAVIHDILDNIDLYKENERSNTMTVVFISRWNVLQGAKNMLGKYEHDIFYKHPTVNLGRKCGGTNEDRLKILDYHLTRMCVDVSDYEKQRVISFETLHGFPHCCRMYAEIKVRSQDIDIQDFFSNPLKFLDNTTKVLVEEPNNEVLFKLLLENNGQLEVLSTKNKDVQKQIQPAVSALDGSYLNDSNGIITFSHPSIYESVARCIGKKDMLFAIESFSFSFLLQNVKFLDTSTETTDVSGAVIYVPPTESCIEKLCQRFQPHILKKNFKFLKHHFFRNKQLCQKLFASMLPKKKGFRSLLKMRVKHKLPLDERDENGDTLLHVAVRCGNHTAVCVLLELGAGVDVLNKKKSDRLRDVSLNSDHLSKDMGSTVPSKLETDRETPLQVAFRCTELNMDIVKTLIEHGADVNRQDTMGQTPLHNYHILQNEYEEILTLHGADVNRTDRDGRSPLHQLCQSGEVDERKIKQLISHGAIIDIADKDGKTAFHYLCSNEMITARVIRQMINHGASVNKADKHGMTPFHYFCQYMDPDTDTLKLIIAKGATVNKTDKTGMTPLHKLCKSRKLNLSSIELIIKFGADVAQHDNNGVTPLFYMFMSGKSKYAVELVCKHCINLNQTDQNGMTCLHHICLTEIPDEDIIEIMVKHGASVNQADRWGRLPLHYLCQSGYADERTLIKMLRNGAYVNEADIHDFPPIHYLCQYGRADESTIDMLIRYGLEINKSDLAGKTLLHYLCRYRPDENSVYMVIQHGADVNRQDNVGMTPLHYLCQHWPAVGSSFYLLTQHGADVNLTDEHEHTAIDYLHDNGIPNTDVIFVLLQTKMDINAGDEKGFSPLHYLCEKGKAEENIMYLMLKLGADIYKGNKDGITPLHYLCMDWKKNERSLYMALKESGDVNKSDNQGQTPFHYLCQNSPSMGCIFNVTETQTEDLDIFAYVIDLLLQKGADINNADNDGLTPFHYLCMCGAADSQLLQMVLEQGADVNKPDRSGFTPLHYLCQNETARTTSLSLLCSYSDDVNRANEDVLTPLHCLCQCQNVNSFSIERMLSSGAIINKCDKDGLTPLNYLCQNRNVDSKTLLHLLKHCDNVNTSGGDGITPLHSLCQSDKQWEEAIRNILEKGANVNKADDKGLTPLHHICRKQNASSLDLLIKHGGIVNKADLDGLTPLHYLCQQEHVKDNSVKSIITAGADVNLADHKGLVPLHYLCQSEFQTGHVMHHIIEHSSCVNKQDKDGMTPLHYLCQQTRVDDNYVKLMITSGADVNIADHHGQTPIHYLCQCEFPIGHVLKHVMKHSDGVKEQVNNGMTPLHYLCQVGKQNVTGVRKHNVTGARKHNMTKGRRKEMGEKQVDNTDYILQDHEYENYPF